MLSKLLIKLLTKLLYCCSALEAQAKLGGEDLIPFYGLMEGGREGELFAELEDYFYYAQIRRSVVLWLQLGRVSAPFDGDQWCIHMGLNSAVSQYHLTESRGCEGLESVFSQNPLAERGQRHAGLEIVIHQYCFTEEISGMCHCKVCHSLV